MLIYVRFLILTKVFIYSGCQMLATPKILYEDSMDSKRLYGTPKIYKPFLPGSRPPF